MTIAAAWHPMLRELVDRCGEVEFKNESRGTPGGGRHVKRVFRRLHDGRYEIEFIYPPRQEIFA